jgi:hypothetical protein
MDSLRTSYRRDFMKVVDDWDYGNYPLWLYIGKVGLTLEDFGFYHISYPVTNEFGTYNIEWYIDI